MVRSNIKNNFLMALPVVIMLIALSANSWALDQKATPNNLHEFSLPEPYLSADDQADVMEAQKLEQNNDLLRQIYNQTAFPRSVYHAADEPISGDKIDIEIYQNTKLVGKQFLLARQNSILRYVFAVSAGGHGKITPNGTFPIIKQRWRHMSTLYPSQGENNMDHASYFAPAIAFHSTVFGLYSKLGKPDSHGCVRMARPEARAIYFLIKANGVENTSVRSFKVNEPSTLTPAELEIIKFQLAMDLNFIKDNLLGKRQRGDVPFKEGDYFSYKAGTLDAGYIETLLKENKMDEVIEILPEMDLLRPSTSASPLAFNK